ncbi:hypothetical protein AB0C65_35725 [Nocardia sp. NPDC048505]|uniref:hypothetical protein n=1 Tax=Nocardia sp. NPDC048505 TaxID=3155756 RepID=UPI0033FF74D3
MPRPKPPEPDYGEDVFAEKQPATASLLDNSAPPPPLPAAPTAVVTPIPEPEEPSVPTLAAEERNAVLEAVAETEPSTQAEPVSAAETPFVVETHDAADDPEDVEADFVEFEVDFVEVEASVMDRHSEVDAEQGSEDLHPRKVDAERAADAIVRIIKSDPAQLAGAVQRLASATNGDHAYLDALQKRIYESTPPAGKHPEPLDVAPNLHSRVKTEAQRQRRQGDGATVTTVILEAIGDAHARGKIPELIASFRGGERHRVPLFGNVKVGTAPRGATVKMQFAPDSRSRMMLDVLTAWYRVPRVNLVRLVLEDRYRRKKAAPGKPKEDPGAAVMAEELADTVTVEAAS